MAEITITEADGLRRRRAFVGAVTGHVIEWYDYGIYGFLAVYMGQLFFASEDPTISLLSSFAVFALSFFIRPLGGLVFGPMADRIGRKQTLLIVLICMAGSTCLIGLLPTYATIGLAAPILLVLLRCIQGFSAGGEIGTVTSFIAEYAGPGKRGHSTSWLMTTAVLGLLLGSLVANGMSAALGEAAMLAWGWRIPFLFAGVLGMIAIYIRLKLEDSPEFLAIVAAGESSKAPLRETMTWGRALMLVFCIITVHASIFYLVLTYASTFLGEMLQFSGTVRFWFIISACVLAAAVMPIGGIMSDKWGRKPVLLVSGVAATLSMLWFFLAAPGATPVSFFFPLVACALSFGFYASSTYATMTELLPTKIRSTGIAVAYNLPVAIFGGSAPLIAAWFISATGDITSPWYFFVGTGVVSLAALLVLRRDDFTKAEQVQAISANQKAVTEVA
ncbi:MFS transporter [Brevibacterium sediminis]|uniref:MFS transporter n=1 Tax=Brevibacterium sediminis TaxID=1857024 RepID=UPI0021756596|nr:MFS transporter [Brevibacterium sediminis]MCS4593449.1 MFS transporter [Brevibacterium sediminis]